MERRNRRMIGGLCVGLIAWLRAVAGNGVIPVFGHVALDAVPARPHRFDPTSRATSAPAPTAPAAPASAGAVSVRDVPAACGAMSVLVLPPGVSLDPSSPHAPAWAGGRIAIGGGASPAARPGPMAVRSAAVDAQAQTLSASALASGSSTSFGFVSTAACRARVGMGLGRGGER